MNKNLGSGNIPKSTVSIPATTEKVTSGSGNATANAAQVPNAEKHLQSLAQGKGKSAGVSQGDQSRAKQFKQAHPHILNVPGGLCRGTFQTAMKNPENAAEIFAASVETQNEQAPKESGKQAKQEQAQKQGKVRKQAQKKIAKIVAKIEKEQAATPGTVVAADKERARRLRLDHPFLTVPDCLTSNQAAELRKFGRADNLRQKFPKFLSLIPINLSEQQSQEHSQAFKLMTLYPSLEAPSKINGASIQLLENQVARLASKSSGKQDKEPNENQKVVATEESPQANKKRKAVATGASPQSNKRHQIVAAGESPKQQRKSKGLAEALAQTSTNGFTQPAATTGMLPERSDKNTAKRPSRLVLTLHGQVTDDPIVLG